MKETIQLMMAAVLTASGFCAEADGLENFEKDREAILAMAGEYEVKFRFEESFPIREGYELKERYDAGAREVVKVVSDTGGRIVLQHLLVVGDEEDETVIKHWGQIWTYQDERILNYQGDVEWLNVAVSKEDAAGKWAQLVTQTDDTPRYESLGKWRHLEGASEWVSGETRRPLPRREYTKRDDYDVLVVQNRHIVTAAGWSHFQHNLKRNESGDESFDLCMEIGLNTYRKIRDGELVAAEEWWKENESFWVPVNKVWVAAFDEASGIDLEAETERKPYARRFKDVARAAKKEGASSPEGISELVEKFIVK